MSGLLPGLTKYLFNFAKCVDLTLLFFLSKQFTDYSFYNHEQPQGSFSHVFLHTTASLSGRMVLALR